MDENKPKRGGAANLIPRRKGDPGLPGAGRPKTPPDVKQALAAMLPAAVKRLGELLLSDNEKIAVQAVQVVLDRNLGKAIATKVDVKADLGAMHLQLLEEIRARRLERLGDRAIDVTPRLEHGDTDKVEEYDPPKPND